MRRTDAKETKKRYFRAGDRIANLNGAWYFCSREGDVGPFPTRGVAESEVQRFLVERHQLRNFQRSRQVGGQAGSKTADRPALKAVSKGPGSMSHTQKARHHLDQKVASDGLMLTLDEDFLI